MAADTPSMHSTGDGPFDARLPGLTPRQSQRVRDLARRTLAERGLETVVHAEHLVTADGRSFGLANLASKCHNCGFGEEAWPSLVAAHLDAILAAYPATPPPDLTTHQMRTGTYLRLVHSRALPGDWLESFTCARPIGAGFLEMLAHRDGDFVRWLRDEDVEKVGVEELREIGRRNLLTVKPDAHEVLQKNGSRFHVVRGESGFIASKVLVLRLLLPRILGPRRHRDGVLVAVPNRHELALAPMDGAALANLAGMWAYAPLMCGEGVAPISPFVYWWREGQLTQLTDADRTGQVFLRHDAEFVAAVERLCPGLDAA